MKVLKVLATVALAAIFTAGLTQAGSVSMKISGPGAVNDSTIKAGEPVSFDVYIENNDSTFTGFSLGFALASPTIEKVIHVTDSGNGLNPNGDIKGYNGWEDHSIWNFGGVYAVERDWDGALPELIGFGGLCVQQVYLPHEEQKCLSLDLIVPEAGVITFDSAFYPPGGRWLFAGPKTGSARQPEWKGPYKFKVLK